MSSTATGRPSKTRRCPTLPPQPYAGRRIRIVGDGSPTADCERQELGDLSRWIAQDSRVLSS